MTRSLLSSSGLAPGDHILSINGVNVQTMRDYEEKIQSIKNGNSKRDQLTLIVVTKAAYRKLKKRGGKLSPELFTYNQTRCSEIRPRSYFLTMEIYEHSFGLELYPNNSTMIRKVQPGSIAFQYGIQAHDTILEINNTDISTLSNRDIKYMIDEGERRRKLSILVIDIEGYKYCLQHAIPINSQLPFVSKIDEIREYLIESNLNKI